MSVNPVFSDPRQRFNKIVMTTDQITSVEDEIDFAATDVIPTWPDHLQCSVCENVETTCCSLRIYPFGWMMRKLNTNRYSLQDLSYYVS